eukprot:2482899-Rhodomonas_salina.2
MWWLRRPSFLGNSEEDHVRDPRARSRAAIPARSWITQRGQQKCTRNLFFPARRGERRSCKMDDEELYDEFGNYIGPEDNEDEEEDDEDDDELEQAYR